MDNESEVDDPSVYENDLRIKEKRFGPNHPQVRTPIERCKVSCAGHVHDTDSDLRQHAKCLVLV